MYPRVISALFYMFFTCVISIRKCRDLQIYLYVFIPFLDPDFSRFLAGTFRRWSAPLFIAVAVSLAGSPTVAVWSCPLPPLRRLSDLHIVEAHQLFASVDGNQHRVRDVAVRSTTSTTILPCSSGPRSLRKRSGASIRR